MRLFLALLFLGLSGLSQADQLLVGTLNNNPPFEIKADGRGHLFGFDIDIMDEICKRIGKECDYQPARFDVLFSDLLSGKTQVAIGGLAIEEDRQKDFLTSLPYLISSAQFITKSSEPINSINDIAGKTVGVLKGSIYKSIVLDKFGNNVKIIEYNSPGESIVGLYEGKIDVLISDKVIAEYWVANSGPEFKLVGEPIAKGYGYGILTNKNNADLIAQINKALLSMQKDGTYTKIYNRYFGG